MSEEVTNIECLNEDRIRYLLRELEKEPVGTDRYEKLESEVTRRMSEHYREMEIRAGEVKAAEELDFEKEKNRFEKLWCRIELGASVIMTGIGMLFNKHLFNKALVAEKDGYIGNSSVWKWNIEKPVKFIFWKRK